MARRLFCADIEGDDLLYAITKMWVTSYQELDQKMEEKGKMTSLTRYEDYIEFFGNPDHILVMHNGIAFDKPAVEKVLKAKGYVSEDWKVQAEVVDTLYLSWYLYPKQLKHGLGPWGEELGIAKEVIEDWEGLSLEQYISRCESDVLIQVALWKQMWKHLKLLYGEPKGCWHIIRHLNFKAHCAALQEKSRWKLDVKDAEAQFKEYEAKYEEARAALEAGMPVVPVYAKKSRPKKPYKVNGELSATGKKWHDLVKANVDPEEYDFADPMDYVGSLKVITGHNPPNAGSSQQLKSWLDDLGWIPESFKFDRNKATNEVKKIPQIKNQETDELCESIVRLIEKEPALKYLEEMSILKHRLGVVRGLLNAIDEQGYVYAGIQGLTNTLRFKHKICVNLPSTRKPYGKRIRGLLMARNDKLELCGSDMSSLEDRTKQHYMWEYDPEYVKQMQSPGFDPHLDMCLEASLMTEWQADEYKRIKKIDPSDWAEEEGTTFKALDQIRHGGKGTNYSATYGARGATIARTAGVSEEVGEALYQAYWQRNWSLKAIADNCVVKNSRGLKWLWNPVAKIWVWLKADKDRFSTLNQSTGTYAFDRWLFHVLLRRPQLTGQFHDELIVELKKGNREAMERILKDAISEVNKELKLNRDLDCDVGFGRDYSKIH